MFGALSGGIGAVATGGNFWEGAAAGAIVSLANHALHDLADGGGKGGGKKNGDKGDKGERKDTGSYKKKPDSPPEGFEKDKPKGGRWRGRNPKTGEIIEWDGQHGEYEVYNRRGKHKGTLDPEGKPKGEAIPGRRIKPMVDAGMKMGLGASVLYIMDRIIGRLNPLFLMVTPVIVNDMNTYNQINTPQEL